MNSQRTEEHSRIAFTMRRCSKAKPLNSTSLYVFALISLALMHGCVFVHFLPSAKVTHHLETLVVMETAKTDFGPNMSRTISICREFYRHYEDKFDVLVLIAHNPEYVVDLWEDGYAGRMKVVRNAVAGIGVDILDVGKAFGSENRLKGVVRLVHANHVFDETLLHELMHLWKSDREVIPSTAHGHWGFSSVGGQLGGFQLDELRSLGDGKYSAGHFAPKRAMESVPYSPLEMYLAGWITPSEVPDIWVAEDGSWLMSKWTKGRRHVQEDAEGNKIFKASQISTWSIEQIIEKLGPRSPNFEDSQKEFRVAFVYVTDGRVPLEELDSELAGTQFYIEQFTKKELVSTWLKSELKVESRYNFWEATRGIATIEVGNLQSFRRVVQTPPK